MKTVAAAPTGGPEPGPATRSLVPYVVAVTTLAAGLMLYSLGSRSLHLDEGFTVGLVRRSTGDFLYALTHWEVNQAPYYVLFRGWYQLGEGQATMRLLSVAFGVATVPVIYLLGKRLFDERVGLVAAVLLTLNAMVVQWSQQLRAYSMLLLLATLATWALVRAVDRPGTRTALLYAALATLAVYTHFFAVLVIGTHAVTLLAVRPLPRRLLTVVGAVMTLPLAAIAVFVLTARTDPLAWIEHPSPAELVSRVGDLAGGNAEQLVVYGLVALAGLAVAWRAVRTDPRSEASWRYTLVAAWLVLPLAVVIVLSYAGKPLLEPRYLIIVCPPLALVAALGLVRLPQRQVARAAAVALVTVSALGVVQWYRTDGREDWRGATAAVLAGAQPGDIVVVQPFDAEPIVAYYERQAGRTDPPLAGPSGDDPAPAGRLWEVARRTSGPRPVLQDWNPRLGYEAWRDRNYVLAAEQRFTRVDVLLYERSN